MCFPPLLYFSSLQLIECHWASRSEASLTLMLPPVRPKDSVLHRQIFNDLCICVETRCTGGRDSQGCQGLKAFFSHRLSTRSHIHSEAKESAPSIVVVWMVFRAPDAYVICFICQLSLVSEPDRCLTGKHQSPSLLKFQKLLITWE